MLHAACYGEKGTSGSLSALFVFVRGQAYSQSAVVQE